MVVVCKGSFHAGISRIDEYVYVEIDREDYEEGVGPAVDCERIANCAIELSGIFDNRNRYGMFGIDFRLSGHVMPDDVYDYESLDRLVEERNAENMKTRYRDDIENVIYVIEFKGKKYKVWINFFYGD